MARNLYVTAAEPYSGKVLVSLGIMGMLERTISRLGFFRPIARPYTLAGTDTVVVDRDVHLMREQFQLDCDPAAMCGVSEQEAQDMLAEGRENELHERILEAYKKLEAQCDFVVCEGSDFLSVTSAVETEFNSDVARNLNAPVMLVVDGSSGDDEVKYSKARIGLDGFRAKGCSVLAAIFNKVPTPIDPEVSARVDGRLRAAGVEMTAHIPHDPNLAMRRMDEVAAHLDGRVLFGSKYMHNKIGKVIVASGSVETMLPLLDNNVLLMTHIDRHDAILMSLVSLMSHDSPNIAGVLLTGERELAAPVMKLLQGLPGPRVPIVRVPVNTYEAVMELSRVKAALEPGHTRELLIARQHFDSHVDVERMEQVIRVSRPTQMTPKLFKYELIQRARADKKRIVLPEGDVERILKAADALLRLRAVELILLGDEDSIRTHAGQIGVELDGAEVVNPATCAWRDEFAQVLHKARAHKGMTLEMAHEAILEPPMFGTLMVHSGRADGMVAGATTSTAATIRPAFQILRTKPGFNLVSSVFFMCLADRVLVYGDCAVNPDPTAEQLAEIAIASAETAQAFGIEPIVAMLSYSTGESGQGADVDKVKAAVQIAKKLRPALVLEGPLQYDAAVDASVARTKLPDSEVGGRATVFIFPDLNTGNNTYKAVQRSAHAVAIGPVMQGLCKPVNDLSRGCLVEDIVNTVAITAIQAQ